MPDNAAVVIIGGGFSGLASAYALQKKGIMPLIIEKCQNPGGMASCHKADGFLIERFYHHFFSNDFEIIELIKELENENGLIWGRTSMGFFYDSRLYGLTTPFDLLRFSHIGLTERLGFALFSYNARKEPLDDGLDGIGTEEWLGKKIGSSAYYKVMAPLMKSKFGVHMNDISAAFLRGRVSARVNSRTRFFGREKFGYLSGGLDKLSEEMAHRLIKGGAEIRLGAEVKNITVRGDCSFTVEMDDNSAVDCAYVISTTPFPLLRRHIFSYADRIPSFPQFDYRSVVCMCLGIKKSLSKYYWINIASDELPFGIIIEHTNLVPVDEYGGDHIIYLATYCDSSSQVYGMNDDDLLELYLSGLKRVFTGFNKGDLLWSMVSREPFASPVFRKNFGRDLENLRSLLPKGLYMAGNLLTYPNSRNVNSAVRTGMNAASALLRELENI